MTVIGWLQPRDHAVAARTVSILCLVAAAVTIVFTLDQPSATADAFAIATTVVLAGAVIVGGWMMRYVGATHQVVWAACPFLAIAVIVTLDVLTADGSVGAQIFLFFPALYGASQLPRRAAAAVSGAAVIGDIVVVLTSAPLRTGLVEIVYVAAALITTVLLLVASEERQAILVAQLQRQAAIDPLTGLATRRVLDRAAQSALSGAASGDGTALILLDVDDFKGVNDRYGHPGGDEVLVQLANRLIGSCREHDIVSRLGGDEIALLLPGCSPATVLARADQILCDVRSPAFVLSDGQEISITVSAGLAHAPTHALSLRTLYAAADGALYAAKRAGRNRASLPVASVIATDPLTDDGRELRPAGSRSRG